MRREPAGRQAVLQDPITTPRSQERQTRSHSRDPRSTESQNIPMIADENSTYFMSMFCSPSPMREPFAVAPGQMPTRSQNFDIVKESGSASA